MDYQRDFISEEAIMNIYNGIEQDIPEYVYYNSNYTEIILKMVLEIRCIHNGYGKEDKAYSLLKKWISQCPLSFQQKAQEQAICILEKMCIHYGCWRDIKNICLLLSNEDRYSFFIKRALQLLNNHLYSNDNNVAKWIPREGSFIEFDYLATDYVQRFLQIEQPLTIKQIRRLYKNIVKKKQLLKSKRHPKTLPPTKTKRSIQEAETAIIEKALVLSKKPPSAVNMNEEDDIEEEWLNAIQNYETINNAVFILDTPLSFTTTPENLNRLKTACRIMYKTSLPSRKRVLITTAPEPFWVNVIGKTLVETIRTIVQYTEVNDNPTEDSRMKSIKSLLDTLKICEIPFEETEKMSWIILSNFSQQSYSIVHSGMTNLFLSHSFIPQNIPNMIYIKSTTQKDIQDIPLQSFPSHTLCWSSLSIRTFWTECLPNLGISNNHWNQIARITKDPFIRQFTPFQNAINIVSENVSPLHIYIHNIE